MSKKNKKKPVQTIFYGRYKTLRSPMIIDTVGLQQKEGMFNSIPHTAE